MAKKAQAGVEPDTTPPGAAGSAADGGKFSKTDAVQAALREGISSPKEIAEYLQSHYGMTISAAHVSNIKSKSGHKRNGRRGRRPKAAPVERVERVEPRPKLTVGALTADELDTLLQLAKRMGGVKELRDYLDILGRYQG